MQGAMPISMATVGTAYTIKKISGNTEVRSHLKSMGFNEGTEVKLITQLDGDVIIHVKESRVAINKDQARHILVEGKGMGIFRSRLYGTKADGIPSKKLEWLGGTENDA